MPHGFVHLLLKVLRMLGNRVVGEVRVLVFQPARVVVGEGESQVAVLVEPYCKRVPLRDDDPLPHIELFLLDNLRVLDVLLRDPSGLDAAADAYFEDSLEPCSQLDAPAAAFPGRLQHPNVLHAVQAELWEHRSEFRNDLAGGDEESLVFCTSRRARRAISCPRRSSLALHSAVPAFLIVARLRAERFIGNVLFAFVLRLDGSSSARSRLPDVPFPRLQGPTRVLQRAQCKGAPLLVAYERRWGVIQSVVDAAASPLADRQCDGHRRAPETGLGAAFGGAAALGDEAPQHASACGQFEIEHERVDLRGGGQVVAPWQHVVHVVGPGRAIAVQVVAQADLRADFAVAPEEIDDLPVVEFGHLSEVFLQHRVLQIPQRAAHVAILDPAALGKRLFYAREGARNGEDQRVLRVAVALLPLLQSTSKPRSFHSEAV
mmetsp:Transcript_66076/g.184014  ORF Transcript_66076/g.184014 Transcript_66076/m.184014 type:complete len:432 (+) Transcript_66076:647-1942(+)